MEQRSDEWYKARLGKITGSGFKDVMTQGRAVKGKPREKWGATAIKYARQIVGERRTQQVRRKLKSRQMDHGIEFEEAAVREYQNRTYNLVRLTGFIDHSEVPNVGCSPDGLIGLDGYLEIKCPYDQDVHLERLERPHLPKEYEWQVQGGLWVTGRKWADFVSYSPDYTGKDQLVIFRVDRDEEKIQALADRVASFEEEVIKPIEKRLAGNA